MVGGVGGVGGGGVGVGGVGGGGVGVGGGVVHKNAQEDTFTFIIKTT